MILSDRDIKKRLEKGDLVIDPLNDLDTQIQPASIDLRLGNSFFWYGLHVRDGEKPPVLNLSLPCIEEDIQEYSYSEHFPDGTSIQVDPGEMWLATTKESIKLPSDLAGRLEGRSSIGRLGLVVHLTAGFIDPGFEGQITLEMCNVSRFALSIPVGIRISQLTLIQLSSPAERPYGPARGSKYQGQTGATPSRIARDA